MPFIAQDRVHLSRGASEMELKRDLARNSVLTIIERDNERVSNNPMIQQTDNADSRVRSLEVPENE